MAKEKKPLSKAELKDARTAAKEEYTVAKDEQRAFEKENGLAKGEDHSGDKKVGKKWKTMNDMTEKKKAAYEAAKTAYEEAPKEKVERESKYAYPDDVKTAADKKKYRAKMRADAKKAEKEEGKEKTGKKKDKGEKAEKEQKVEKSEKSSKKDKKQKAED